MISPSWTLITLNWPANEKVGSRRKKANNKSAALKDLFMGSIASGLAFRKNGTFALFNGEGIDVKVGEVFRARMIYHAFDFDTDDMTILLTSYR